MVKWNGDFQIAINVKQADGDLEITINVKQADGDFQIAINVKQADGDLEIAIPFQCLKKDSFFVTIFALTPKQAITLQTIIANKCLNNISFNNYGSFCYHTYDCWHACLADRTALCCMATT